MVLRPILRAIPSVLKWAAALLFLVNIRSWPLVWHSEYHLDFFPFISCSQRSAYVVQIWRPIWHFQLRFLFLRLRLLLKSRKEKQQALEKFFDSLPPIGQNPFDMVSKYRTWAGE